uniref:Uncharacterized protein n=1 Tax=Pseudomonas phage BL5 TaxID=3109218 RepID=A0AAU7B8K8_9VIRU
MGMRQSKGNPLFAKTQTLRRYRINCIAES